jgi:hypothetical protein
MTLDPSPVGTFSSDSELVDVGSRTAAMTTWFGRDRYTSAKPRPIPSWVLLLAHIEEECGSSRIWTLHPRLTSISSGDKDCGRSRHGYFVLFTKVWEALESRVRN